MFEITEAPQPPEEEPKKEEIETKEEVKISPRKRRKRFREGPLCDRETELDFEYMREGMSDTSDIVMQRPVLSQYHINWKARALWLYENICTEGLGEDILDITRQLMKSK